MLTVREKEILDCIAAGRTSKEIADKLNISKGTVDKHRKNMLKKLNASNSVEMVTIANSLIFK